MRTLLFSVGLLVSILANLSAVLANTPATEAPTTEAPVVEMLTTAAPTQEPVIEQVATAPPAAETPTATPLPAAIPLTPELIEAHHAYRLARLRWQQYRWVQLPRERQMLSDQIRLLESEIKVLRRRQRDYRPFLQVGRYSPVQTAAENDRLVLLASEQQLKRLRNDRINQMRYSRQHGQLYQLDVLRTSTRIQQLMAGTDTAVH